MKNVPMFDAPPRPELTLSKALLPLAAYKATYAPYRVKGRVQCAECVNVLHEAHGKGEPPRRATVARNVVGMPDKKLLLCGGHAELWRERDGVSAVRKTTSRGRR